MGFSFVTFFLVPISCDDAPRRHPARTLPRPKGAVRGPGIPTQSVGTR